MTHSRPLVAKKNVAVCKHFPLVWLQVRVGVEVTRLKLVRSETPHVVSYESDEYGSSSMATR
jgi:hypothetical protein